MAAFRIVIAALAAALATRVPALAQTLDAPNEWTMFRLVPSANAVVAGDLETSWTLETGSSISSSPTIAGDTLYSDNNGGWLTAIDVRTGSVRWRAKTQDALMSAPLVIGGVVIVGEGNAREEIYEDRKSVLVGIGENRLLGFDAATGAQRWSVPLLGTAMPTPALVGGLLVHHDGAGRIVGVDPQTGAVRYSRYLGPTASMVAAIPIGRDEYVTDGSFPSGVWAVRARDGQTRWHVPLSADASGIGDCPPASDGRFVYCDYVVAVAPAPVPKVGETAQQRVYAIDARTGVLAWDVALGAGTLPERNEVGIPLYDAQRVFLGSAVEASIHALDAASGAVVWRTPVHGPVKGGLVAVGGIVYCADEAGYLWALDERTGAVVGSKKMDVPFNVGSPVVAGRTLLIGANTGRVIAIPLADIRAGQDR